MMTFSEALAAVKSGSAIQRNGWNGKGLTVRMQTTDEHSKMTRAFLYLISPKGSTNQFGIQEKEFENIPWLPSQTDILSDDWITVI